MIYTITKTNDRVIPGAIPCSIEMLRKFILFNQDIGVDLETSSLDAMSGKILTIAFGNSVDQIIVEYSSDLNNFLIEIFSYPDNTYVIQNAKFDIKFLLYHVGVVPRRVFDTMLAEQVLTMGLNSPANLEFLTKKYLDESLDKKIVTKIRTGITDLEVLKYTADDVRVLVPIKEKQQREIYANKLSKALDVENKFVKALAYIELSGIYLDRDLWEEKCVQDDINLATQESLLNEWVLKNASKYNFGDLATAQLNLFNPEKKCNILWSSPKQVISLFNIIGIDTKTVDTETGELKDSVEEGVILYQAQKFDIIPIYLQYKAYAKVVSTYGRNVYKHISPITGRVHTKFRQLVSTGRLSSGGKDKKAGEEFINLQNIPADHTRSCFRAMSGNKLINADYKGQEQVIFANRCLDSKLLEFYDKNLGDMHKIIVHIKLGEFREYPKRTILSQARA